MHKPLEFHPSARLDALDAYDWYADRSQFIADEFEQALRDAGRAIQDDPERWAVYLHGTRRYILKRFPYVIVYRASTERIEIIAVAHGHQKPGHWKQRLRSD